MSLLNSRRQFLFSGIGCFFGFGAIGCGTILHPERKGQPAGDLDWSIVALDGVGLLLFLVPGVIAFAVDFNNGSIYLPAEVKSEATANRKRQRKLIPVTTSPRRLTNGTIEHVVAMHSGHQIRLRQGQYETHPLENLDQFWGKRDQLQGDSRKPA